MNHRHIPEPVFILWIGPWALSFGRIKHPALWCMHISGSDEVHARASKEAAQASARQFNEWFAKQEKTENTPLMIATVQLWPHGEISHADDLATQKDQFESGAYL